MGYKSPARPPIKLYVAMNRSHGLSHPTAWNKPHLHCSADWEAHHFSAVGAENVGPCTFGTVVFVVTLLSAPPTHVPRRWL